jgi:hypothetical protein
VFQDIGEYGFNDAHVVDVFLVLVEVLEFIEEENPEVTVLFVDETLFYQRRHHIHEIILETVFYVQRRHGLAGDSPSLSVDLVYSESLAFIP